MIKKILKKRKGFTLVELVVTFALLCMFSVALLYVLTSSMNVFKSASDRAYAQTVSEILLEKITGELGGAQPGAKNQYGITIMERSKISANSSDALAYETNECISFCTRTGSQIYIATEKGRLLIHYRPLNDNDRHLDAVDWQFDDNVYNGYIIDNLTFSIVENKGISTNILRVSLAIRNESSKYTYTSEQYVECFNFSDTASVSKISYDAIYKDEK